MKIAFYVWLVIATMLTLVAFAANEPDFIWLAPILSIPLFSPFILPGLIRGAMKLTDRTPRGI